MQLALNPHAVACLFVARRLLSARPSGSQLKITLRNSTHAQPLQFLPITADGVRLEGKSIQAHGDGVRIAVRDLMPRSRVKKLYGILIRVVAPHGTIDETIVRLH